MLMLIFRFLSIVVPYLSIYPPPPQQVFLADPPGSSLANYLRPGQLQPTPGTSITEGTQVFMCACLALVLWTDLAAQAGAIERSCLNPINLCSGGCT